MLWAHPLRDLHWSARLSAAGRQFLTLLPALAIGLLVAHARPDTAETPWLAGWVVYCTLDLSVLWFLALRLDASATRRRAQWNDPGAAMLFTLVTTAACASLVAVVQAVQTGQHLHGLAQQVELALAMASLAGAWLLIQTNFALHYARTYYRPPPGSQESARGLEFPGDKAPDYLDFLYYSAVIGMTSQVSDISAQGRHMRRLTLMHSLLSFAFNLVVLAVAVNVFASSLV